MARIYSSLGPFRYSETEEAKALRLHYTQLQNECWKLQWNVSLGKFSLPKGTILQVDRIYIRQGGEKFSSLTFIIKESPDPRLLSTKKLFGKQGIRFWAKLVDVNNIYCNLAS